MCAHRPAMLKRRLADRLAWAEDAWPNDNDAPTRTNELK
jgi:hypothetical protein